MRDKIRTDTNMGHTVILATIYFPLLIVVLVLVTIWGMNAAGSRSSGYGQVKNGYMHSREIW